MIFHTSISTENKTRPHEVFAVVGKGGTGKTTFTYFFARALIGRGRRPLLIDADPALSHLARALAVIPEYTIEEIRTDLIGVAARGIPDEKARMAHAIDEVVAQSIHAGADYDLLVMGQPRSVGCFCPSNTLLRGVLEKLIDQYDTIVIDCEAGLEQIHRQVIRAVDYLVIIADSSPGSLATAQAILASAQSLTRFRQAGLVINRATPGLPATMPGWIETSGVVPLGAIPEEPALHERESSDLTSTSESEFSSLISAVDEITGKILGENNER